MDRMDHQSGLYRRSGGFRSDDESFECPHGASSCYICANKTLEPGDMGPEDLGFKWLDRMQARQPMHQFRQGPQEGTEHFGDEEFADINREFLFQGLTPPRIRPKPDVIYSEPEDRASVCPHGVYNCQFCANQLIDYIHPAERGFKWLDKMVGRQHIHQFPQGPQEGAEEFDSEEFPPINTLYMKDNMYIVPPLPKPKPKPVPKPEPKPKPKPKQKFQQKPKVVHSDPKVVQAFKHSHAQIRGPSGEVTHPHDALNSCAVNKAEGALNAAKIARAEAHKKAKRAQRLQEKAFEATADEKVAALDCIAATTLKSIADVVRETTSSAYTKSIVGRKKAEKKARLAAINAKAAVQMESRATAKAKAAAEAAAAAEVAADVEEAIQSEIARGTKAASSKRGKRGKVKATVPTPCQAVAVVAMSVSQAIDMEADRATDLATVAEATLEKASEALYVAEQAEEQASQRLFNACSESFTAAFDKEQTAADAVTATTVKVIAQEAAKQATMEAITAASLDKAATNLAAKAVTKAEQTARQRMARKQREKSPSACACAQPTKGRVPGRSGIPRPAGKVLGGPAQLPEPPRPGPVQLAPPAPSRIPRAKGRAAGPPKRDELQRPDAVQPLLPSRFAVPQGAKPSRLPVFKWDRGESVASKSKSVLDEPAWQAQDLRCKEEVIFDESRKMFGGPPRKVPRCRWRV